jgi:hypothetical protein
MVPSALRKQSSRVRATVDSIATNMKDLLSFGVGRRSSGGSSSSPLFADSNPRRDFKRESESRKTPQGVQVTQEVDRLLGVIALLRQENRKLLKVRTGPTKKTKYQNVWLNGTC